MNELDITRLRHDTPGCEHVLHLDHAGSSLPPAPVHAAIKTHLDLEARWGGYRAAEAVREPLAETYRDVATLIGCEPAEVALTDSATRAWQLAFAAVRFRPGDRIICSRTEYASNHLAFLQRAEDTPIDIVPIPPNASGELDLEAFADELERGAALVALTHVPTNGGLVHPAAEVGRMCRRADVPLLLDACQSAGQVALSEIPWDFISCTGRKYLRGPRGTGFLGVRQTWLDRTHRPLMDLHGATWTGPDTYEPQASARRFELWEKSIADVLGLKAAIRYALDCGIDALEVRIAFLADELRARLRAMPGVVVRDLGQKKCGLVTFTMESVEPPAIKAALRDRNVHVSVSRRKSTLLDMDDRHLSELVRASVHALTTIDELDRFVEHLSAIRGST